MTFQAKYPGRCGDCGEAISAGDPVQYVEGVLVHGDCDGVEAAATELDRDLKREVCPVCFLLKPCDCEVAS